ncbi:MAG: PLP-dependent aminotransferase family protein [Methyloceanibacter sp.]|nr:PLP-dependent aminotransferase family protein [Methyloceanibacter sp.]
MDLWLLLDKSSGLTLQTQVFEQIRRLILCGRLKPGMPLPSTRELSDRLKIARNTVTLAYDRLNDEGFIEVHGRSGTYVSSDLPDDLLDPEVRSSSNGTDDIALPQKEMRSPLLCYSGFAPGVGQIDQGRPEFDFWVGRSDPSTFPLRSWRQIMLRKLSTSSSSLTEYGDPAGLSELRVAIAGLLGRSRGMSVAPAQVVITNGSQDGLNLICRLLNAEHPVFIENPCYQGAAYLFQSIGAELCPIPVDKNGIVAEKLPKDRSGVLFVTPSHQYPTGATLSLDRRISLLRWAEETNSVIIEDDYDSDFRYEGRPLTALAGLDGGKRVFYLGSFSKSLGAGLRLGFTVVPEDHADLARIVKSQMSQGQPWLDQAVLADFIEDGLYDRHLRRLRKTYMARRDCLTECLDYHFGAVDLTGSDSGLHVAWRLPSDAPPASEIERRARQKGVGVYALHSGGAHDFYESPRNDTLVLGYSSLPQHDIECAIERLRKVL